MMTETNTPIGEQEPSASMVERVVDILRGHFDRAEGPGHFTPIAREVIAAMREPTEGMYDSGGHAAHEHPTMAMPVWAAMIDAALAEGTER